MAFKDYSDVVSNARKKKKEEEKNSSYSSSQFKDYSSVIEKQRLSKSINLDTFESDINTVTKNINKVYNGWQTQETMKNTRLSIQGMYDRIEKYQNYQKKYGGTDLSELLNSYKSILDGWDDLSKQYSRYKSADAYTKAVDSARKALEEEEKMKTADLGTVKTEISGIEEILKNVEQYEGNINSLRVQQNAWEQRSRGLTTDRGYTSKVEKAENELNEYLNSVGYNSTEELKKALGEKKVYLNKAEWLQKGIEMSSVGDKSSENYDKDFAKKSKYVEEKKPFFSFGPNDTYGEVYEYINADKNKKQQMVATIQDSADAHLITNGYDYMTDQEVATYNYYYNQDKDKAAEYLKTIAEELGNRKAVADFERYDGKTGKELLYGVQAGLDQFASGLGNLFNTSDEYIPVNATQQLSGMIRDDMKYRNGSIGQGAYDLITTTSNMMPSILTSAVIGKINPALGAKVGTALMGSSAAGNAYQEMLNLGYDKNQARTYSALVGTSEALLQTAIGGIGKLGGVSGKLSKVVSGIDNGLARFAVRWGGSALSEGFEEATQEVLTPLFHNLAAGYDTGDDVDWSEVIYSGLLGALSGGLLEGGSLAVNSYAESSFNKAMGSNIRANERVDDLFNLASDPEVASAYETYTRYAKKGITSDNISDAQLGRMYSNVKADAVDTLNSKKSTSEQRTNALKRLAELSVLETENTIAKEKKNLNVGEETTVTESGEKVDVKDLKVKGEDIFLATKKGEISAENMTFSNKDAELVAFARVISRVEGEDVANLFINQYDGKTDVDAYANSFNLTMTYAKNDFSFNEILNKKGNLSAEQVNAIYRETRIKADKAKAEYIKKLNKEMADKGFYKGFIDESVIDYNNTSNEGKINWKDLTDRQRKAVTFVKGFAQATGMNLVFVANETTYNGKYDRETNTFTINLDEGGFDAINKLHETIIPTMSHETTHWMKEKSPELWRNLNEIVFSTLTEHYNSNTEQSIKDKIALLDRLEPHIKHTEEDARGKTVTEEDLILAEMNRKGKSEDISREEIIARACEDMLKMSEQGRKIFFSLSETEQKTLVGKIKALINDLLNWANDLLNSYEATSTEARIMRDYKEQLQKASKVWDEMLKKSVVANQSLEKSGAFRHNDVASADSSELLSAKNVDGKSVVWIEENILKENKGQPVHQFIANFIAEHIGEAYTIIESGQKVYIGEDLPGEYTQSVYTQTVLRNNPNIIKVKNRATANIGEIIEIATNRKWEKAEHSGNKDAKYGIYKYNTRFGFPVKDADGNTIGANIYKAKLVIRNASDGKKYLYDIVSIKKDTASSDWLSKKIASTATKAAAQKNNVSKDSILNSDKNVKEKITNKDSTGRELSKGQQEYFKDSVVRDEIGNLLAMYRGDSNEFTVFDRKKTNYSNLYGRGFYFTKSKAHAEQYGASREFYLDIKNPLSPKQNVITKNQMLNFLKAIENDGEDYDLYNYGQAATAESVLDSVWGKGDFEMLQDISAGAIGDLVAAVELFNEVNGTNYDGIILPTETVTFNSEQGKLTSNLNPTKDKDMRFSMKENVEETKDLIAVHNMQVSELERTLDLGGLPMPSIAVIKAKSGHSEYGDVSLVFPKSTIDPKADKNNKVYGGDAWTPTYPKIEYKPNAKISKKISDKYYELSRKFGNEESRPLYNYVYDMEDILNRHNGEAEMIAELYEDERMMQLYLLDSGGNKVETIQKEVRSELSDAEVEMNEFFINELGADVVDAVMWDGNDGTPMSHRKNYLSKYESAIRDAYKKLLSVEYQFTDEQVQNVMDSTKNSDLLRFMRDAHKYRKNGRVTTRTEADYEATKEAIKESAGEGYRKWVDSLFKGIEEKSGIRNNTDYFTNSGNRRSWEALHWENNLENVIKVMKSQDNGVAALFSGHAIWAVSAKDYRSIEELKADSDRLKQLPEEEYNKIKEGFGERFQEIAYSIMSKTESNPFIASDNAMSCIVEAVRNSKTKSGILNYLKQFRQLTVTETSVNDIVSLVTDISNMPTEYFEAKPKRAVELNEIATAIIPDNTSEATKTRLSDMGVNYLEYESGNEDARLKVLNSLNDVRFSEKDSDKDYIAYDTTAILKESTIDNYLASFAAKSSPNYAQAYIAYMSPSRFLRLTTSNAENEYRIEKASTKLEKGRFEKATQHQPIHLTIDHETGEVIGHEGRHRMVALEREGIYSVPVLLFDYSNKESKKNIYELNLIGQFNEYRTATIDEAIPLSYANRDLIIEKFGTQSREQKVGERLGIRETFFYSEKEQGIYDLMGETERIRKENEKFKAEIERLNERLKIERNVTKGNYFNENQLGAVAGHLRNISNSRIAKDKLVESLKDVYSFIAHSPNLTWEEVFERCYNIADAMFKEAKPITIVDDYSKYLLKEIRNTRISLSETQKQNAKHHFGNNWNRYFMGKVVIANDGINIDSKWQEWSHMYPDVFDADTNSGDMLSELYDIIDSLKSASEIIDEYGTEEQKRWLANEIYNQFWNVSPIRTTADKYDKQIKLLNFEHRNAMKEYRDAYEKRISDKGLVDAMYYGRKLAEQKTKHSKELSEQKQKQKELHKKLYADFRERKEAEVALAKQHGREMLNKHKENAEKKTYIQSITSNSLSLNELLVKNSKDKHVPEIMREPVASLLQAIDFSSKRMFEKGEPTRKDISLSKSLGKVKDMMVKASNAHDELVELYGHGLDEDIEKMVDSVDEIMRTVGDNEYVLNKMSLTDLKTLNTMVKTIKHAVNKLNKFHTVNHARGIANLSKESVSYLDSLGKSKIYDGLRGKTNKLLNWGNALPYYVFKRYGSGGMKVYEALQDGWDKFAFNTKKIIDYANEAYTDKEVNEWSEEVKTFNILLPANEEDMADDNYAPQYQEVQLTVSQIMSMHCLNKREQARGHLFSGGIRVADIKTKKGEIISQSEGIIFTEKDIATILNSLTGRQKEVANKLQRFMNEDCTIWGNEVSMARFGYKAFGEENYFPIQSDKNNLAVNDETEQANSLFKLLNMSFTKSTVENANNRIVISDIFDVFAQHTSDMAKYNALALPVLDAFKWYNFTEKQDIAEGTFKTSGVKQSIERAFGKDGQSYFTTFLKDINGQQEVSRDTLGSGFFKNAKIASVGANWRVILLQPTSYVRASAVIDNKYLSKAFMYKPKVKKAETYCGIALWKSMGYYDTNIQKGLEAQIKHADTWKDKVTDFSMKGAEIADKVTWGYLWNACELEIRDTRKDLKVGSKEFYEAIGKRLREVIYATQVVDSTMTRSQMMRSSDGKDKLLTAFASEPTLSYNMVQDAYMQYRLDARRLGKGESIKKNGKRIARILTAYTMTNAVASLVESAFDALRDDEEEEMDVATFMKYYISNFANDMSITAKIPYIKELHSAIQGFSSSRTDTQWMEETTKAITAWYKFVSEGKGKPKTIIRYSLKAISDLSGLPFYNAYRDTMAVLNKLDLFTTEDLNEMFGEIED